MGPSLETKARGLTRSADHSYSPQKAACREGLLPLTMFKDALDYSLEMKCSRESLYGLQVLAYLAAHAPRLWH